SSEASRLASSGMYQDATVLINGDRVLGGRIPRGFASGGSRRPLRVRARRLRGRSSRIWRNGSMSVNIGIVGATGQVGEGLRDLLEQRNFTAASVCIFASARSVGKQHHFLV